jgi:hypothetical protein
VTVFRVALLVMTEGAKSTVSRPLRTGRQPMCLGLPPHFLGAVVIGRRRWHLVVTLIALSGPNQPCEPEAASRFTAGDSSGLSAVEQLSSDAEVSLPTPVVSTALRGANQVRGGSRVATCYRMLCRTERFAIASSVWETGRDMLVAWRRPIPYRPILRCSFVREHMRRRP